jgi:hypothetical protein
VSWDELIGILKEARTIRDEDRARPVVDCPVCGNRLDEDSKGVKNCDVGHYRSGDFEAR